MGARFYALTVLFGLLFGVLGFNLYQLQVERGGYYSNKAQARNEAQAQLELRRGQIFFTDRSGTDISVALNRDYPAIYAVPKEIADPQATANKLAPLINLKEADLVSAFSNRESLFKLLVDKAGEAQVKAVEDEPIIGIYTDQKQSRFYPFNELASQMVGFVGMTNESDTAKGLYGVEKLDDEKLASGSDVRLTIDRNLQAESEAVLEKLIQDQQAVGGAVVIQEPATGKILTLTSKPDFDPNEYYKYPVKNFLNPTVQLVYEPGSVFKPFTMSAGIDTGAITPDTTFVDTGSVTLNGKTIRNWDLKAHGKVTMTNVIELSINTGAIFAETQIGNSRFHDYLKRFGFGEETGVDLPDEAAGSIKNLERKDAQAVDFATAAYGQGTSVTPVQLITAFSAIANGGVLMRPYVSRDAQPLVVRRVISEDTAKKVTAMMESAVKKAQVASIPGYRIAGKTGTAFIPDFVYGGYTTELIHTYVGFAPVSNPKFVILIKLEKPKVAELAGVSVVPAFHDLATFVLNYLNVPPDDLGNQTQTSHN